MISDDVQLAYQPFPICPYYKTASGLTKRTKTVTITCECPADNLGFDVDSMLRFKSRQERRDYMEIFCCDRWQSCPYAVRISLKYKEDR